MQIRLGETTRRVAPEKTELARAADLDENGTVSEAELETFVRTEGSGVTCCRGPQDGDYPQLARELSYSLAGEPNPVRAGYHSFSELITEFDGLAADHPGLVKKEVLGQSPEGRDLVAYRFSQGDEVKPGIVVTGMHHAREWMTVEAPLQLAKDLLAGNPERLQKGEVWIVPCANPDGYEYSREHDSWWRKNRNGTGVDLNRNYESAANPLVYRPASDKPGKTSDDFPNTSDNPRSEVYRGPSGNSEPEVQALQALEARPNIKGTIDYHSYGNNIFYPWDHTRQPCPDKAVYQKIGAKMAQATGWSFGQGSDLYLNAGDSTDNAQVNGRLSFCFEMGRSFQPGVGQIPLVSGQASKGTQVFIDEVLGLGSQEPPPPPPPPQESGGCWNSLFG